MNVSIFAYSRQGCKTAKRIAACFSGYAVQLFTVERLSDEGLTAIPKTPEFYAERFRQSDALVFVSSCGIAVRKIAPYVRDKKTDPAVVCVDELGSFSISLLSGHIGGANDLARFIADGIGALPVVTTATDINRKFSVDAWAARNGLTIGSMELAKAVSARILEETVPLHSDFPVKGPFPGGIAAGSEGDLGISVSWSTRSPFEKTLHLIPKCLHLGIGCRRGTPESAIREAVASVLRENAIAPEAVKAIASIDLKADEPGLLNYCASAGIVPVFYTAEQLLEVSGEFTSSAFVQSVTGVDNVCERSALAGADRLIVKKIACSGVTVAAAVEKWEVSFE